MIYTATYASNISITTCTFTRINCLQRLNSSFSAWVSLWKVSCFPESNFPHFFFYEIYTKEVATLHLLKKACFYVHIQMKTNVQNISTAVF